MNSPGQAGTRTLLVQDKQLNQPGHQDCSRLENGSIRLAVAAWSTNIRAFKHRRRDWICCHCTFTAASNIISSFYTLPFRCICLRDVHRFEAEASLCSRLNWDRWAGGGGRGAGKGQEHIWEAYPHSITRSVKNKVAVQAIDYHSGGARDFLDGGKK